MSIDIENIKEKFSRQDYLFTLHGSSRAIERFISSREIEEAITNGKVIEDYPDDKYGPSCLILGKTKLGRILHIQVSYPAPIKIITVYVPSPNDWNKDWETRKES